MFSSFQIEWLLYKKLFFKWWKTEKIKNQVKFHLLQHKDKNIMENMQFCTGQK